MGVFSLKSHSDAVQKRNYNNYNLQTLILNNGICFLPSMNGVPLQLHTCCLNAISYYLVLEWGVVHHTGCCICSQL